ncbi:MAG: NTP transferase domain-containing protein [Halanaerobiaceae bacterium]|nr:NTP transferase domain-containing protein [Halanaerobiaceae bacterium]
MKLNVVILAGAPNNGPLRKVSEMEHEALIKIAELPMVEYVIRAVNQARYIDKIAVVGHKGEMERIIQDKVDFYVESVGSMKDNIFKGLEVFKDSEYLLIMTSDIPLITGEDIDEYIETCLSDNKADIYYPIIPKKLNQEKFPSVKRTYFHLAEGVFTGGNMVIIRPQILEGNTGLLEKAIAWRKKPWKLSRLLGMKFILKFVIGHLSITEIENKVAMLTGCKGHFMITNHPEIGFDVDKPSDLKIMEGKIIS